LEEREFEAPGFQFPLLAPGKLLQGEPLGVVPGLVEVFGLTVEGWVLLSSDGGFVELAPGTLFGGLADPVDPAAGADGGLVDPVDGNVADPAGATVEGGDAEPGACVCRALVCPEPVCPEPEVPAGGAPPAGALWAAIQVAQPRKIKSRVTFPTDIDGPPLKNLFSVCGRKHGQTYPAYSVAWVQCPGRLAASLFGPGPAI